MYSRPLVVGPERVRVTFGMEWGEEKAGENGEHFIVVFVLCRVSHPIFH